MVEAVWRIPEIARGIIAHLSPKDVKRVLQCCRRDFELALPYAWREGDTTMLRHLLLALPFEQDESTAYGRLCLYANNIQRLNLHNDWALPLRDGQRDDTCMELLHQALSNTSIDPLFPLLQSLQIAILSTIRVKIAILLIRPTLDSFTIDHLSSIFGGLPIGPLPPPMHDGSNISGSSYVQALIDKLAVAKDLTKFTSNDDYAFFRRPGLLQQTFTTLPNLASVYLSGFEATPRSMAALVSLSALNQLEVYCLEIQQNSLDAERIKNVVPFFPSLRKFTCGDHPEVCLAWPLVSRMNTLEEVSIAVLEGTGSSRFDLGSLMRYIAQSSATLQRVKIQFHSFHDWRIAHTVDLHACQHIKHFDLRIGGRFLELTDIDFIQMARAWPKLSSITMKMETWREEGSLGDDPSELASASLNLLHSFALHCPELSVIRLPNCIGSPHTSYPVVPARPEHQNKPLRLTLGDLTSTFADSNDVGRYIAGLWPGRKIELMDRTAYAKRVCQALKKEREAFMAY